MVETLRKITGYQLREAIKRWELHKSTAAKQFDESLWAFEGDDKASPGELADTFLKAEDAVAKLQTLQARYNLSVVVDVLGSKMSLCQAVKMVGGAGRHEKMWRNAATNSGQCGYAYGQNPMSRKTDEVHAKRTVSVKEAIERADRAARLASALRSAIALGNGQEREMEVPSELLD